MSPPSVILPDWNTIQTRLLLNEINDTPNKMHFIEVHMDVNDTPEKLNKVAQAFSNQNS